MSYTVYKHTNKTNNKVYIGVTSKTPQKRWKNGRGYKNIHFGRAIKKYGWDGFNHEIIAGNLSKDDAYEMEKILIKAYDATNPKHGYNEALGGEGGGMYNKHHSPEAVEKIRSARKRDGFTEEHKRHISEAKKGVKHHLAKKVYQYDKQGNFIKEWEYMTKASIELGINKANIAEVCKGNRKSAGGYVWRYERG